MAKITDEKSSLEILSSNCLEFSCPKESCNSSRLYKSDRVAHSAEYPKAGVGFVEIREGAAGPIIHRCEYGRNGKNIQDWTKEPNISEAKSYPGPIKMYAALKNASRGEVKIVTKRQNGKEQDERVVKSYYIKWGEQPMELVVQLSCSKCGGITSLVQKDKKEFYRVISKQTMKNNL